MRTVIKAGGSAGVDRDAVADLVAARAREGEVVFVHGASAETDRLSAALGHPARTIVSPSGHQSRRTDRETLELFAMAALGRESFLYLEKLQARGIDAISLSGPSGRALTGTRKDVRAVENGKTIILRDDHTGSIDAVATELLESVLRGGRVPVVAPLAIGADGGALNVDGDRAAARIAAALGAGELLILTNVPGLLRDVANSASVVARATVAEAEALAGGRMKKKVLAAKEALAGGVPCVRIRSATANAGDGTVIVA
jgi:acetylglutamate/LysW-gamma-L-alpha-aminoadipate kinase